MPSLEDYSKNADELAQKVVDAWAAKAATPGADATVDFRALFAKACEYRKAKRTGDNRRMSSEYNVLFGHDTGEETTTRRAFAVAFKDFHERNISRLGEMGTLEPEPPASHSEPH